MEVVRYTTTSSYSIIVALLLSTGMVLFAAGQGTQQQPTQQGGSCGKNTLTFGCHAYIYGNTGSATSYAGRADSVFVDAQYVSQNPALAQRLNQTGPVPFFYVNAYCEKRFGGCGGPQLSGSSVAAQYGEIAQHPNSAEFFNNFNKQLGWVKQAQGKVIEIDNMDFYIEKGHKAAIIKLIQLAANAGINVLSKNVRDTEILRQPNVVGAVVEEGSGNASDYHSAFTAVGKQCAGVLMINAKNKTGNSYTSFTECDHPSRGDKSEYTKCTCKKNPSGMQIAGTPVAGPNVDIPQGQLPPPYATQNPPSSPTDQTQQQQNPAPQQQAPTSTPPAQTYAPTQASPQQPQFLKQSDMLNQKQTEVKDPLTQKQTATDKKMNDALAKLKAKNEAIETDETEFHDPLGSPAETQKLGQSEKRDTVIPKPFGDARLRCMPTTMLLGTRPTIAWACGRDATRSVGVGFNARNFLLGSERVSPLTTTLYAIKCYNEDMLIGSAQCTIKVYADKSVDESFRTPMPGTYDATQRRKVCFLSFCL